ncbi:hypothetical protein D3C73_789330 [compost metagenome]
MAARIEHRVIILGPNAAQQRGGGQRGLGGGVLAEAICGSGLCVGLVAFGVQRRLPSLGRYQRQLCTGVLEGEIRCGELLQPEAGFLARVTQLIVRRQNHQDFHVALLEFGNVFGAGFDHQAAQFVAVGQLAWCLCATSCAINPTTGWQDSVQEATEGCADCCACFAVNHGPEGDRQVGQPVDQCRHQPFVLFTGLDGKVRFWAPCPPSCTTAKIPRNSSTRTWKNCNSIIARSSGST